METTRLKLPLGEHEVDGLELLPAAPVALCVHAHGAGAGIDHAAQGATAAALAANNIATLRFNFPYMQAGRSRVDAQPVAVASIRAAVRWAVARHPGVPLWLSGHSFGGRMASHAALQGIDADLQGLVFCSFPLHPAGKPGVARAAHLGEVHVPMLFVSGTRDALADRALLQQTVDALGQRARLYWLDTADHGYKVLKRSRTSSEDVFAELARVTRAFIDAPPG